MNQKLIAAFCCLTLAACNTPPSRIAATYHGSETYEKLDCKRLGKQLGQLDTLIAAQRYQLQSDANLDMGIVAGSLILVPIGLFALAATGNGTLKHDFANNLGKQTALKQAMEEKECDNTLGDNALEPVP